MTPRYRNSSTSSEVSRASQTQYAPQVGLPQSMPVISASAVKLAPIGAAVTTATSASFMRQISAMAPATDIAV